MFLAASIGVCLQAYKASSLPTTYVSYARLVTGGKINLAQASLVQNSQADFFGNARELLLSGKVRKRAAERVEATFPELKAVPVALRINRSGQSSILNVSATGGEGRYTVAYLDALLNEFVSFRRQMRDESTDSAITVIMERLLTIEGELEDRESDLVDFLAENNVLVLQEGGNRAASYLSSLKEQKSKLEAELSYLGFLGLDQDIQRRSQRASALAGRGVAATKDQSKEDQVFDEEMRAYNRLGSGEESYMQTKQAIQLLMLDKTRKGRNLKRRHPEMMAIDEAISKEVDLLEIHEDRAKEEAKHREENMRMRLAHLDNQIIEWEARALDMSDRIGQHNNLKSVITRVQDQYNKMLSTLDKVDTSKSLAQDFVSILEKASSAVPREPDIWKPVISGLFTGLVLGLIIVFLFDKLDDRMTSFSEFQTQFSEDILGQIPQQNSHGQLPLLEPNDGRHLYGEAFRNLRSSLIFKDWGGSPPKTICVCSAVPNEGKTTVAANLAITMALAGARVLVVDADLRRGAMAGLLEKSSSPGFSDVLMGKVGWESAVTETQVDNLAFLPRGEAIDQTSEYVLSDRCTRFLEIVGGIYDYVIFDTAPVLVADDTASFAPKCDATLFVVRLSSTMARLAAKAMGVLYDRQVNVGGVVLNRASTSLKEYSYYNYASYYTARPAAPAAEEEPEVAPVIDVDSSAALAENDATPPVTKI